MITVISPSKTLNFESNAYRHHTLPFFSSQIQTLAAHMKTLSRSDLETLMNISPKLSALNHQRYQDFAGNFTLENSKQALLAFKGDVYQGILVDEYSDEDFNFAQNHLRILSGLYGLLRPLDLIQPYRLEMGTRLSGPWGNTLYHFWDNQITEHLDHDIKASKGAPLLVNLASNEYVKAVRASTLKADMLNIVFKENKAGTLKVIGIHAKRARGLMVDFIIRNRIDDPENLKDFSGNGYGYSPELSDEKEWVFTRG